MARCALASSASTAAAASLGGDVVGLEPGEGFLQQLVLHERVRLGAAHDVALELVLAHRRPS
jgi:hypothetical protein